MDLDTILCDETLEAAWRRIRTRSPKPGADGVSIEMFGAMWPAQRSELRTEVLTGGYSPQPLLAFDVAKAEGTTRTLLFGSVRDRLLQTAMLSHLETVADPVFAASVHGWRPGRSIQTAVAQARELVAKYGKWALRTDIADFFPSLDHDRLLCALDRLGVGSGPLALIRLWLRGPIARGGSFSTIPRGVPQGAPLSPLFANLYLNEIDHALEAEGFHMIRYGDDVFAVGATKSEVSRCRRRLAELLQSVGLHLKAQKTFFGPVDESFRYLGQPIIRPASDQQQLAPNCSLSGSPRWLYVSRAGTMLRRSGNQFLVTSGTETLLTAPARRLAAIVLAASSVPTLPAIRLSARHEIPILLATAAGQFVARIDGNIEFNLELERRQWVRGLDQSKTLPTAAAIVSAKIRSQSALLQFVGGGKDCIRKSQKHLARLAARCKSVASHAELMGFEGRAAAIYFPALSSLLPDVWRFPRRSHHPPADPANSLLSFAYSLLHWHMELAIRGQGLTPRAGFLHTARPGLPALVCDLVEEFRAPLADRFVVDLILTGRIRHEDFQPASGRWYLAPEPRRRFLAEFERTLWQTPGDDLPSWRELFQRQSRRFAEFLMDRAPAYRPFEWSLPCS